MVITQLEVIRKLTVPKTFDILLNEFVSNPEIKHRERLMLTLTRLEKLSLIEKIMVNKEECYKVR